MDLKLNCDFKYNSEIYICFTMNELQSRSYGIKKHVPTCTFLINLEIQLYTHRRLNDEVKMQIVSECSVKLLSYY